MKSLLSIFLCIIFLMGMSVAEAPFRSLLKDDFAMDILDVAPFDGSSLAILSAAGVFLWDGRNHTELISGSALSCTQSSDIFVLNKRIFLLDIEGGTIFSVINGKSEVAATLPADLRLYENSAGAFVKTFGGSAVIGSTYYFLLTSFTEQYGDTYELYSMTDDFKITHESTQKICHIYGQCENRLISAIPQDEDTYPGLYDPQQGISMIGEVSCDANTGFALNSTGALYYVQSDGTLIHQSGGHRTVCGYLPTRNVYTDDTGLLLDDTHYAYLTCHNLHILDVTPHEQTVITIMGHVNEEIVSKFSSEHPEITVSMKNGLYSESAIEQDILTNGGADLYVVATDGLYPYMVEKKYAAKLNDSIFLPDALSDTYSWVQDTLFQDGCLYAVPVSVTVDTWTLNETQWNAFDLGSIPVTWDQMLALSRMWKETYADDHPDMAIFDAHEGIRGIIQDLVHTWLLSHEHWNAPVSFDAPEFRAAVSNAMGFSDCLNRNMDRPLLMDYPQYFGAGYNDSDRVVSILPPAVSDAEPPCVRAVMDLLVMSAASPNQSSVILFLEYYLKHLAPETAYRISSLAEPVRSSDYEFRVNTLRSRIEVMEQLPDLTDDEQTQLEILKSRLARWELEDWLISAKDIEIYHGIMPYIVVPQKTIYPKGISEQTAAIDMIIAQFTDGSISLDTFIARLNEKSEMIFAEMQ